MIITIDRFEGNFAVVEMPDKTVVDMPISLLPEGVNEGDCISITVDKNETESRKKRIEKLAKSLWSD